VGFADDSILKRIHNSNGAQSNNEQGSFFFSFLEFEVKYYYYIGSFLLVVD
jgi:hypothetical protein